MICWIRSIYWSRVGGYRASGHDWNSNGICRTCGRGRIK